MWRAVRRASFRGESLPLCERISSAERAELGAPVNVSKKIAAVLEGSDVTRLVIRMFLLSGDKPTIESDQDFFNPCTGNFAILF